MAGEIKATEEERSKEKVRVRTEGAVEMIKQQDKNPIHFWLVNQCTYGSLHTKIYIAIIYHMFLFIFEFIWFVNLH